MRAAIKNSGLVMPGILPTMALDESLEVTRIYSVADTPLVRQRPFSASQHTISHAGLVGGGRVPHPGETRAWGGAGVSLAHTCTCAKRQRRCKCRGVLFLDELPEFDQRSLEVLR